MEWEGYIERLENKVDRQRRELANLKGKRQRLADAELTRLRTIEEEYIRLKRIVDSQKKDIASLAEDNERLRAELLGRVKSTERGITRPDQFQFDHKVGFVNFDDTYQREGGFW